MSESFFFNCFIVGDDPDRTFIVDVLKTGTVSLLRDRIKEENPSSLGNVETKNLDLWHADFLLDDLTEKLVNDKLRECPRLSNRKKLSSIFNDVLNDDFLHIIAKPPEVPPRVATVNPAQILSLNCLIHGEHRMFTVKVEKTDNVSTLTDLIKEKNPSSLGNVNTSAIDLWKVNFPFDDLKARLAKFEPDPDLKLISIKKLLSIFKDGIDEDCIHVIVKAPVIQHVNRTQLLSLNCLIHGEHRMFTVKVEKTDNVSILTDLIKEKKAPHLNHVAPSDLDLWKVNFPIDDLSSVDRPAEPGLRSEELLLDVFPAVLDVKHIHVLVLVKEPRFIGESDEERDHIKLIDGLGNLDDVYSGRVTKDLNEHIHRLCRGPSPSDTVHSVKNLRDLLDGDEHLIHLGRPGGVPATIFNPAIAMLQLRLNHLEGVQVVRSEIERAAKYLTSAITFHEDEAHFQNAIKEIVDEVIGVKGAWGVALSWADKIRPDGVWWYKDFLILALELKNTLGLSGDALLQSIVDYSKIVSREKYKHFQGSCNFPIVLVGATANRLEISVAVFIGHIYVTKLLTVDLSLGFHASDNIIRLARVFKSLSHCCIDLKDYYDAVSLPLSPKLSSLFPSPTPVDPSKALPQLTYRHFLSRAGQPISALVNLGNTTSALYTATLGATHQEVIVKFTTRYNAVAHRLLAEAQLAPTLHFCERVVGDLYMVVMDRVNGKSVWQLQDDKESVPAIVSRKVQEAVSLLHTNNIVFGDLRDPNILYIASKDSESAKDHVVLIDFDWPDEDGKGRYPASLNTGNAWAEEVVPYGIMHKAHDMWQLDRLIRLCKSDA